jgi:DNA-binding response OmpR family regulator
MKPPASIREGRVPMGSPWTGARFLIVDDEETNLRVLEAMLRRAGYTDVTSTGDPRQVISLYSDLGPDIVLLDLMMPHMDGYQLMEELSKEQSEDTYLPIVVLTADTTRRSRERALSLGANDFLTKPFDQQEVLLRIRNLLETRALYLRLQEQQSILEVKVQERTKDLQQSLALLERSAEEQGKLLAKLTADHRA